MISIDEWLAHRQAPLRGDAHDQECLPRHHYVLPRVEEVREHLHIYLGGQVHGVIADDEAQEQDVQNRERDQALMER